MVRRNDEASLVRKAFRVPDRRRQIVQRDVGTFSDDDGALDDVLELAYVARPAISQQGLRRLGLDRSDIALMLSGESIEEMLCQQQDILCAVSQRRNSERDGIDTEV